MTKQRAQRTRYAVSIKNKNKFLGYFNGMTIDGIVFARTGDVISSKNTFKTFKEAEEKVLFFYDLRRNTKRYWGFEFMIKKITI